MLSARSPQREAKCSVKRGNPERIGRPSSPHHESTKALTCGIYGDLRILNEATKDLLQPFDQPRHRGIIGIADEFNAAITEVPDVACNRELTRDLGGRCPEAN